MTEPRITEQAESDLDEAWEYLAQRSIKAADRFLKRILDRSRLHARSPLMGRPRDDLVPGLRSFAVDSYVIFYRLASDTIEILRVLYGARDIEAIMKAPSKRPPKPSK
ncbi:MAG TPA: type II toxin-antitoxin system RelE/ParE family toxin [Gemmataceae bacterium]|jgi:toxin ParE1/3/4|nr:type II toxin-antitoxin system RelE/ParE family toxin [Gemmataceae bacterium]